MPKRYEKGNWPAVNTRYIVNNVQKVFTSKDITKLNKMAYEFITLKMGFIAHYSLYGFRSTYRDVDEFASRLLTSEYSDDPNYNYQRASEFETQAFYTQSYGEAYCTSSALTIRQICDIARRYLETRSKAWGLQSTSYRGRHD